MRLHVSIESCAEFVVPRNDKHGVKRSILVGRSLKSLRSADRWADLGIDRPTDRLTAWRRGGQMADIGVSDRPTDRPADREETRWRILLISGPKIGPGVGGSDRPTDSLGREIRR